MLCTILIAGCFWEELDKRSVYETMNGRLFDLWKTSWLSSGAEGREKLISSLLLLTTKTGRRLPPKRVIGCLGTL